MHPRLVKYLVLESTHRENYQWCVTGVGPLFFRSPSTQNIRDQTKRSTTVTSSCFHKTTLVHHPYMVDYKYNIDLFISLYLILITYLKKSAKPNR